MWSGSIGSLVRVVAFLSLLSCGLLLAEGQLTFSSLSPSSCNFAGYDFSCLSTSDFFLPSADTASPNGNFSYSINVCGTSHNSECTAASPNVSFCQLNNGAFNDAVDINELLTAALNLTAATPVWSFINGSAANGIQYVLADGELCANNPRVGVVQFVCGNTTLAVDVLEDPVCTYTLLVSTPLACTDSAVREAALCYHSSSSSSSSLPSAPTASSSAAAVTAPSLLSSSVFSSSIVAPTSVLASSSPTAAPAASSTARGAVIGDPQFVGLRGQSFQIHGVDGQVYSLIADAAAGRSMRINARFTFLDNGRCPNLASPKNCWSHAGSYLSEVGVWTEAGDRLVIRSGGWARGFASVNLSGRELAVSPVAVKGRDLSLTFSSAFSLSLSVGNFELELENSDLFINVLSVRVLQWARLRSAHGLLGQTWRLHNEGEKGFDVPEIEGFVDDYAEAKNELLGGNFGFTRGR